MRKGFTLVELSIVLVVIGLLIGGILASQSMIRTAKINKTIKMLSEFDVATTNFHTKFKQLPGDTNKFPRPDGNFGNNDGIITYQESVAFWEHLSKGVGLKNAKGANYVAVDWAGPALAAMTSINYPELPLDQDRSELPLGLSVWTGNSGPYANRPYFQYMSGPLWMEPIHSALRPADVYAIDRKIDDGLSTNTGRVYADARGSNEPDPCVSGNDYVTSSNAYACELHVIIGTITGTN